MTATTNSFGDSVLLTKEPLNLQKIVDELSGPSIGAKALFIGTTKDSFEGKPVTYLSYEAYEPLAIKTLFKIIEDVRNSKKIHHHQDQQQTQSKHQFHSSSSSSSGLKIIIHHLLGESQIGQISLIIGISSNKSEGTFEICNQILKNLKKNVQIWKKEVYDLGHGEPCWKENLSIV
ncbi:hypothetical protein CROQUDRAFT_48681 [Cronartium quercuum f. sp. fusiforme G11]|uniref:Molybdopterin synthase catalytic subunit n=1 Tax=Cronartium quercuum f. sp. fusiforme G11 TaxID=708437 RepID=A0A9P6NH61_9BASI|nr:hypothetical protein CROQUDRAFT_48681 [Cronartium quercuum f. sp. fusiforme G11]